MLGYGAQRLCAPGHGKEFVCPCTEDKSRGAGQTGCQVLAVFHATEAAADGVRKMDQARHARLVAAGTQTASFHLLSGEKLAIVTAGSNVIHLAVLAGQAGEGVVKRARMLDRYRNRAENGQMADDPAKETDTE